MTVYLKKHKEKPVPQTPVVREVAREVLPARPVVARVAPVVVEVAPVAAVVEEFKIPEEAFAAPALALDADISDIDCLEKMPGTKSGRYYVKELHRRNRETIYVCGKPDKSMRDEVYRDAKLTQVIRNLKNGKDFRYEYSPKHGVEIYKFIKCLNENKDLLGIPDLDCPADLEKYSGGGILGMHKGEVYFKITRGERKEFKFTV